MRAEIEQIVDANRDNGTTRAYAPPGESAEHLQDAGAPHRLTSGARGLGCARPWTGHNGTRQAMPYPGMGRMTDVAAAPMAFDPVDAPTTDAPVIADTDAPVIMDAGELLPGIPSVSVVIPTLNEAGNLPHVLPRLPSWIHELVIVDGLSTDDTVAVAKSYAPRAKVVMVSTPGKGAALRAGFAACTGDIVVMLDADGSTDPQEIPAFVGLLLSGADVVMGSR